MSYLIAILLVFSQSAYSQQQNYDHLFEDVSSPSAKSKKEKSNKNRPKKSRKKALKKTQKKKRKAHQHPTADAYLGLGLPTLGGIGFDYHLSNYISLGASISTFPTDSLIPSNLSSFTQEISSTHSVEAQSSFNLSGLNFSGMYRLHKLGIYVKGGYSQWTVNGSITGNLVGESFGVESLLLDGAIDGSVEVHFRYAVLAVGKRWQLSKSVFINLEGGLAKNLGISESHKINGSFSDVAAFIPGFEAQWNSGIENMESDIEEQIALLEKQYDLVPAVNFVVGMSF
jgi:hypothetical protein